MRIGVLTTSFPAARYDYSGSFILYFLEELPPQIEKIIVLTPSKKNAQKEETWGRIKIKRFNYWWPHSREKLLLTGGMSVNLKRYWLAKIQLPLLFMIGFWQALKNCRKVDIIHTHWIFYGVIGAIVGKLYAKPLVMTLHGSDVAMMQSSPLFRKMGVFALKRAAKVICVSDFLKKQITPYVKRPEKISVFPNGVGHSRLFLDLEHNESHEPTLLWVGRLSPEKNVSLLLTIVSKVKEKIANLKLFCVGGGPLLEDLQQKSKNLGLEQNVFFTGDVSPEKIQKYFNLSDVFVLTSEREGFGIVLIEAMAAGLPIVANNVGAVPEIVTNDIDGYICEKNNVDQFATKILSLLTNKYLWRQFSANGRQKALTKYSWKKIAQEIYSTIYLRSDE